MFLRGSKHIGQVSSSHGNVCVYVGIRFFAVFIKKSPVGKIFDLRIIYYTLFYDSVSFAVLLKKLVQFFQTSRDKWKAKASDKQKRIDFLETKVRDLTNSRER